MRHKRLLALALVAALAALADALLAADVYDATEEEQEVFRALVETGVVELVGH